MSKNQLAPWDVIWLSFRQLFKRMAFWILPNLWAVLLSIPIVTWPAAKAALYKTVLEGLRDPFAIRIQTRKVFRQAFFAHLRQSIALSVINLLFLMMILISINFWVGQTQSGLHYVAVIAICFLFFWWLCQPFIFPVMVENPSSSFIDLIYKTTDLAFRQPLYALAVTSTTTLLTLIGVILMGPVLLLVPALVALISIQAYWAMTGVEIPDTIDPVEYEDRRSRQENHFSSQDDH